jgi:predicted nucleotidyltransferase
MKYDITTSHCFTQHWEVEAKNKEQAAKKIMEGNIKFDKLSKTYVSNKLTRTLVTIPDAKVLAVELVPNQPIKPQFDIIDGADGEE